MRKIPAKLREEMDANPWMHECMYPGCPRKDPQWHHCHKWSGRQINEKWAIMPLCEEHHNSQKARDFAELFSICLMTEEDRHAYPKRDWHQRGVELWHKLTDGNI